MYHCPLSPNGWRGKARVRALGHYVQKSCTTHTSRRSSLILMPESDSTRNSTSETCWYWICLLTSLRQQQWGKRRIPVANGKTKPLIKKKFNANRTSVRPPYQKSTVGAVKTVLRRMRWKSHLRTLKQVYIKSHTANMAGWDLVDLCFKMCLIRIWTLIGPFQSWKAFFCTVLLPILRPARGPSPIRR